MIEAITSLFTLSWHQQRQYRPLPSDVTRSFVKTPGGDLELLTSQPKHRDPSAPAIFFVHGGCGSAGVWLEWMSYLHEAYGGTLYAYSARNHGASYTVPYLRMVYGTPFTALAQDLTACIQAVEELEGKEGELVLVGHSSGGGLVQYGLAQSLFKCRALCLLDAVPHFGNLPLYKNWAYHDPWFLVRSLFHFQHPNSPLSSTNLVHGAFFCSDYPKSSVQEFAKWMPAYEAMRWPMSMAGSFLAWLRGSPYWLNTRDILQSVTSAAPNQRACVCIMVGSQDMMLDDTIWNKQVFELRSGVTELRRIPGEGWKDTKLEEDDDLAGATVLTRAGVQLVVVDGSGHHLQNDLQREVGAQALLRFARQS